LQQDDISTIYKALTFGVGRFLKLCGIRRVVIGVSGGIDSAVSAALYRKVLSPEDILLINMPGSFTSKTTISLAEELAGALDCFFARIPIKQSVELTIRQFADLEAWRMRDGQRINLMLDDVALENVQARDRGARILAAAASAFGGAFTCNANKAEITAGYSTFYGDLSGFLAAIGDLWKHQIYELANYLNKEVYASNVIPEGSIKLTPSAELSDAQNVDENRGDPLFYPYHDRLFAAWVEWWNRVTPEEILEWYKEGSLEKKIGFAGKISDIFPAASNFIADLEKWWKQYQGLAVAKRIQAPPVLAISRRAFGFDHREAQLGVWFSQRYEEMKKELSGIT
jgi:NAD+ synthase (glutamine-hydrolysing)